RQTTGGHFGNGRGRRQRAIPASRIAILFGRRKRALDAYFRAQSMLARSISLTGKSTSHHPLFSRVEPRGCYALCRLLIFAFDYRWNLASTNDMQKVTHSRNRENQTGIR